MNITIDNEFRSLIPPLTDEERKGLEESILKDGCRDALVVWGDILIDGHNRYEICQKHNLPFKTVEIEFADRDKVIEWIILNQFGRRNLPTYERARLALRLKPVIAEKAEKNLHSATGGDRRSADFKSKVTEEKKTFKNETVKNQGCQKSDKVEIDTKKELAKVAGVSHDTIAKVEKIEKKAPVEVKEKLRKGDMSINQAYQTIKREEKEAKREAERQENAEKVEKLHTPLEAQGLFQTIVIDPPWDWGDEGDVNQFGRAKPDYHTMPIGEIEKLPINKISDANCHLYLWVTNRSLPKAFRLIEAWGFRYITCLTWVKPSIGMGNYFRGDTEQVLFAVKGSQLLKRRDVGTHFNAPRGKGHSAKPDEFYDLVETCSYEPYIDIFGRKERSGWSVWGENG